MKKYVKILDVRVRQLKHLMIGYRFSIAIDIQRDHSQAGWDTVDWTSVLVSDENIEEGIKEGDSVAITGEEILMTVGDKNVREIRAIRVQKMKGKSK